MEEFPLVASGEGWTVWGLGTDDPEAHVFVAESEQLGGLSGQYDSGPPRAGRVSDKNGVPNREGPAWNWYLPGRSRVVASSRPPERTARNSADEADAPVNTPSPHPVTDHSPVDPATTGAGSDVLAPGLPHAMKCAPTTAIRRCTSSAKSRRRRSSTSGCGPRATGWAI